MNRSILKWLVCSVCLGILGEARGGEQLYEPLAASVRASLHHSVADAAAPRLTFESEEEADRWLADMTQRLKRYVPDSDARRDLLVTVHYEAKRAGLEPELVLSVIQVESKFRKYAVSRAGARGYMQVMPFWVNLIGDADHNLFNLRTNLRYGCVILRHYLDRERGNTSRALARYNGSLGKTRYPKLVLTAWNERWKGNPSSRKNPIVKTVQRQNQPLSYMGESR
jgi:soluble lytic murein transglycosylase-like protein